ncbi:hypothetical protein R1sor_019845 [Riccia sorocarpa]|uniref:Uncharacterized protein n=1 Tax=Riccia sorocarpa TaxID=122646 RepID=A0ABD3IDS9_9MARC
MGSQSRRQRTVDRKRTDQLGQSSRRIAQANEDRLRLRRQRYAEQQAEKGEQHPVQSLILVLAKHSLKVGEIMNLKEQRAAKLLLANLATSLQTVKGKHTQDDMIHDDCKEMCREMGLGETAELGELALNWWTQ